MPFCFIQKVVFVHFVCVEEICIKQVYFYVCCIVTRVMKHLQIKLIFHIMLLCVCYGNMF